MKIKKGYLIRDITYKSYSDEFVYKTYRKAFETHEARYNIDEELEKEIIILSDIFKLTLPVK